MSRAWKAALLVGLALVLALGPGVLIYDSGRSDRIAEGVSVGRVDVGDMSVEEARTVVRERVAAPARRRVEVTRGKHEFELDPDDAALSVDVEGTVAAAREESRRGNPWSRTLRSLTGEGVDAEIEPRLSFDRDAVEAFVDDVGSELDREPRDADTELRGGKLRTVEQRKGFETDRDALMRRIAEALERPHSGRAIEVPGETLEPDVTLAELAEDTPLVLVVDRENFRLRVYEELELDETYRISVGRAGHNTPAGRYTISNKATNPVWHVPDEPWAGEKRGETIPPGPENPIKARWLGIDDGVGIHGTDEPDSIGRRASHGCIRMLIPQVKELYSRVPVGTPVHII